MSHSKKAASTYHYFRYAIFTILATFQIQAWGNSVGLDWTDNSDNETGFLVERSANGNDFEVIGETPANHTSFRDETIVPDALYAYRVCAFNEFGMSQYTNIVSHELPNFPPSLSHIGNYSFASSDAILIPFSVSDDHTAANALEVSAVSSNPSAIPQQSLSVEGSDGNFTIKVPSSATAPGTSVIKLSVFDGKHRVYSDINVTIVEFSPPNIGIEFISSADSETIHTGEPFLVSLEISDLSKVRFVDYFINGELMANATEAPFDGLLLVDQAGSADLKIVAHLFDSNEPLTIEHTIEVKEAATGSASSANAIANGGFEDGLQHWRFYTNGSGNAKTVQPGHSDSKSATQISINSIGSNTQLFQSDISLKPNTEYKLSFAAYSNTGNDLQVSLRKHSSPYTVYGLNRESVSITKGWTLHTLAFTTQGFSSDVSDGRLSFWFADDAKGGDRYWLDNVQIVEANSDLSTEPETEPEPDTQPETEPETGTESGNGTETEPETGSGTETETGPLSSANLLENGGFENELSNWRFYTNGAGGAKTVEAAASDSAALIWLDSVGSNTQLFQAGINLKPDTEYKITFVAHSNSGNDLRVSLNKHGTPYTNYGLHQESVDITNEPTLHSLSFTTRGFYSDVSDARLSFWFADDAKNGDRYVLDRIQLFEANAETSPETETEPDSSLDNNLDNPLETEPEPDSGLEESSDTESSLADNPNVLRNGSFETNLSSWNFYTNGSGYAKTAFTNYNGSGNAALIALNKIGSNIQLLQSGVSLEPNTEYVLTFAAYSNSGRNLRVALNQHGTPYTNYGLTTTAVDLTTGWKEFSIRFTSTGFDTPVNDGRLYFWFASDAKAGDWYYIDQVSLSKAN
ncbi:carbohydrate binding domain-containing protein [Pelagicoccus sp. NFK12]|uniref:Carbohydrate binding domain-containing protein n=1 Tax=Pelagicoccus enzymogenes TaxID=2773457 RepID=A0A927IG56_9BACT|nr:carbohydrate binding domain-containing protein [Pelagicoccus enzymogenes]MBD5778801.1 carbohydrate binding domain-containing protein [Pelagicoccus enzymogenes]